MPPPAPPLDILYTDEGQPVVSLAQVAALFGITEEEAERQLQEIQAGAVLELRADETHRRQ